MISQPPGTRQIGCGASIQDNHNVLTRAKKPASPIQSGGHGLFAVVLFLPLHRGRIILRTDRRFQGNREARRTRRLIGSRWRWRRPILKVAPRRTVRRRVILTVARETRIANALGPVESIKGLTFSRNFLFAIFARHRPPSSKIPFTFFALRYANHAA